MLANVPFHLKNNLLLKINLLRANIQLRTPRMLRIMPCLADMGSFLYQCLKLQRKFIPVVNSCASVACLRNWQYKLAFPSVVVLTCHFWLRSNMPRMTSWCANLLGSQLFSKGASEFFPTNHEDLWTFDYCWSSRNYRPLKSHFFCDTLLSLLYVIWLYALGHG